MCVIDPSPKHVSFISCVLWIMWQFGSIKVHCVKRDFHKSRQILGYIPSLFMHHGICIYRLTITFVPCFKWARTMGGGHSQHVGSNSTSTWCYTPYFEKTHPPWPKPTLGIYPTQTTYVYMSMGSTHFASLCNIICSTKLPSWLWINFFAKFTSISPAHQVHFVVISPYHQIVNCTLPTCHPHVAYKLHGRLTKSSGLLERFFKLPCRLPSAWNPFVFCPKFCPKCENYPIFTGYQTLEKGSNLCLFFP
jgi:hypothetical protein